MAGMTKPPDPNTKIPRLKCPPGAIDTHFHLFGPKALYPTDPNSVYETADALPETLIAMHRVLGISGGVLVSGGAYGRNPRHMLDTLTRFPNYFRGVAIPPDHLTPQEIDHMHGLGVRGVRFSTHPRAKHLAPILPELAAAVAERGWHVQFYAHAGGIVDAADRLLALPNDIVLDHFGSSSRRRPRSAGVHDHPEDDRYRPGVGQDVRTDALLEARSSLCGHDAVRARTGATCA